VQHEAHDDAPSTSGSGGSAGAAGQGMVSVGGMTAGGMSTGGMSVAGAGAAMVGGGGATSTLRGCPDSSWGECQATVRLTLRGDGPSKSGDGVWSEPLQVPAYPPMTDPPTPPSEVAEKDWDRSSLPAGACVFRVHGVAPSCFGSSGQVVYGPCQDGMQVVPLGYYELPNCSQGISPGCPSADPSYGQNFFWYAVPDASATDTTTIVVCAGICEVARLNDGGMLCLRGHP